MLIQELKQQPIQTNPRLVERHFAKAVKQLRKQAAYGEYTCLLTLPSIAVKPVGRLLNHEGFELVELSEKRSLFGLKHHRTRVYISELTTYETLHEKKKSKKSKK